MEWWLLEQHIKRAKTQVKAALGQLIDEQFVTPRHGPSGRVSYQLNRAKLRDVRRVLKEEGNKR